MKYEKNLIGHRLLYKRKRKGWTQEELVKRINKKLNREKDMVPKQISVYESGRAFPPLDILIILCDIFECSLDYFLCEQAQKVSSDEESHVSDYLGLNKKAIRILKSFTDNTIEAVNTGCDYSIFRSILNNYFTSPCFEKIITVLFRIHVCVDDHNSIFDRLIEEFGKKEFDRLAEYEIDDYLSGNDGATNKAKDHSKILKKYKEAKDERKYLSSKIKEHSYEYMEYCREHLINISPIKNK